MRILVLSGEVKGCGSLGEPGTHREARDTKTWESMANRDGGQRQKVGERS